jgi:L-aminopeptidase/D-esterase-like protein
MLNELKKTIFLRVVLIMLLFVCPLMGQSPIQKTKEGLILKFDFPGMNIGVAENEEGPTGTTVFYFPEGVMGACDVRGGATGTLNSTAIMNGYESRMIDAVVFSGGSWYGLSAATGAANEIKKIKAATGDVDHVSGVLGGIIYDVGDRRFSRVTPDDQLGCKALLSAKPDWFPLGAKGAGRFAMQGDYFYSREKGGPDGYASWPHSGQGAAFATIGKTKIAVFTVVNASGTIVDRSGKVVRCHRNISAENCPSIEDLFKKTALIQKMHPKNDEGPTSNTTLTLVVTNQKLPFWALQRLATQVHSSMARAIQPFSTQDDGDVLYAVTTKEIDNPDLSALDLTVNASELAWDAVLKSVPELPVLPEPLQNRLEIESLMKNEGIYDFYGGGQLIVKVDKIGLIAKFKGNGRIYFDENKEYRLIPATNGLFIVDAPAQDVIRFNLIANVVSGLTINPGPWNIVATRK